MAYSAIQERKNELIRKGLYGSAFLAAPGAAAVTPTSLFDPTTGDIKALPAGYTDLGILTDVGVKLAMAPKSTDILGWGFIDPVRTDITSEVSTVVIECQETKIETIAMYAGVDPLTVTPGSNGVISINKPLIPTPIHSRLLIVAVDLTSGGEIVIARFLPNAQITALTDQVFANAAAALTWGVTFTAYVDSTLGFSQQFMFGGAGWLAQGGDIDVPRIVTCTTATNTTLLATTGVFSAYDVGRIVTGAGIPVGTTIITFTDATHVVLSAATTATATGVAVTVS